MTDFQRGEREQLPGRRNSPGVKVQIDGISVHLRVGEYPDGRLGEFFVNVAKMGSEESSQMDAFAISTSIGLQYGMPLDALVHRFVGTRSYPNGVVTGHDRIRMCSSIHDFIFRHLGIEYLGREDLAHV